MVSFFQVMLTSKKKKKKVSYAKTNTHKKKFHNTLNVRVLAKGELNSSDGSVDDVLITSLGHLSKLRKTNLGMDDKRDFLAYYESCNKKKAA